MKILIILPLVTLNFWIVKCQEFKGVSSIKIGASYSEVFDNLSEGKRIKPIEVNKKNYDNISLEWTKYLLGNIQDIRAYKMSDEKEEYPMFWPSSIHGQDTKFLSNHDKNFKIYYIPLFFIGEKKIKDIYLTFRNDSLLLIETGYDDELIKAAIEKYKPTVKIDTAYKITCTYVISGVNKEVAVLKRVYEWNYPDHNVFSGASMDYDNSCKPKIVSVLKFSSKSIISRIDELKSQSKKQEQEEKDKLKKSIGEEI